MGKNKYHPNEEVAHVENLTLKMRVVEIKWKYGEVSTGEVVKDADGKNTFKKVKKRLIDGILCEWWNDNTLMRQKFHSELLVPWPVAQKGQAAVDSFIESVTLKKYNRGQSNGIE